MTWCPPPHILPSRADKSFVHNFRTMSLVSSGNIEGKDIRPATIFSYIANGELS